MPFDNTLAIPLAVPLVLALHALAVMLIGVPFVIGAALFDKMAERERARLPERGRPRGEPRRATHHWYDPIAHPARTVHDWRVAHARPRAAIL